MASVGIVFEVRPSGVAVAASKGHDESTFSPRIRLVLARCHMS